MTENLTNLWPELFKIIADEVNVKDIYWDGYLVHRTPPLNDKYKEKQTQFDKIYSEYQDNK